MKKKIFLIGFIFLFSVFFTSNVSAETYSVAYTQKTKNYTTVTVKIPKWETLKKDKTVDRVCLIGELKYGDNSYIKYSKCKTISNITGETFDINLQQYGKWTIQTKLKKGTTTVQTLSTKTVGVIADEYNFMAMKATTPVLTFALNLMDPSKNINKSTEGKPIPTYVFITRKHFDFNYLPAYTYANPFMDQVKAKQMTDLYWEENTLAMKAYLKSLYNLNKNSKFNLYVNDFHLEIVSPILFENKIPEANYTLKLVTDGSASYSEFQKAYSGDATAKHELYKSAWTTFKNKVYATGKTDYNIPNITNKLRNMAYAITDSQSNVEWWIGQKHKDILVVDSSSPNNATFQAKVLADPKVNNTKANIGTMLTTIKNSPQLTIDFKKLFKFDDARFKQTRAEGKKIMMILGTTPTTTEVNPATPLFELSGYLMGEFGNEYDFYYKGHPRYPTNLYPERKQDLIDNGMYDLDSLIPAELFIFFNDDLYVSGYQSSTFLNAGSDEQVVALFGVTKNNALNNSPYNSYSSKMDDFITQVSLTNPTDAKMRAIIDANETYTKDKTKLYLIEKQETDEFALWDTDKKMITYYKNTQSDGNGDWEFAGSKTATTSSKVSYTYPYKKSFDIALKAGYGEDLTYKSNNTKVATVTSKGKVTIKGVGTTYIDIISKPISGFKNESKTRVYVTGVKANQKISAKSSYSVYQGNKIKLNAKAINSLTYKSSNKNIVATNSSGLVKGKAKGKVTITISAKSSTNYNAATKKVKVYVK